MPDIKIVFFDIDGTLLDPKTGRISPMHIQVLHQLEAKGIKRCIVTGRPTPCLPDFGDLRFDAIATFNGSLCRVNSDIIYRNPIHSADVRTVLENASALGRPVAIAAQDRLAANGIDQDLADYYRVADMELEIAEDFDEVRQEDIYQILIGSREEEHAALLRNTSSVKLAISWERAVDVIPRTGGKGRAIGEILAHFRLDSASALAFGDGSNDKEMLEAVGTGIAMGNASPQLKAVADQICGHVSEDGIYHYCIEHGLINESDL